jgi:hypothetical protein
VRIASFLNGSVGEKANYLDSFRRILSWIVEKEFWYMRRKGSYGKGWVIV